VSHSIAQCCDAERGANRSPATECVETLSFSIERGSQLGRFVARIVRLLGPIGHADRALG
jgi:hypothetical protein